MRSRSFLRQAPLLLVVLIGGIAIAQSVDGAGRDVPYVGHLERDGVAVNEDVVVGGSLYATSAAPSACHTQVFEPVPVSAGRFSIVFTDVPDVCFVVGQLWLALSVGPDAGSLASLTGAGAGGRTAIGTVPFAAGAPAGAPFIVDDSLEARGELTVGGNADIAGNLEANNAYVGDMGFGSTWAGLSHGSAAGTGSYALLQNAAGSETIVNVGAGGNIKLRVGNVDRMTLGSTGNLDVHGNLKVRGTSFGGFTSHTFNTNYVAGTDGFLNAYIHADTNGDRCDIAAYVDGVLFAAASAHVFSNTDNHVKLNSLMVPVPRNKPWRVDIAHTSGTCAAELRFTPLAP